MMCRKIFLSVLLAIVVSTVIFFQFEALAQDKYPSKPIEIVLAFVPGGPADVGVRFFTDKWSEFLGQPVVVTNKDGASGAIASKYVLRSKPDGYTLLQVNETSHITGLLGREDSGYTLDSFRYLWSYSKITAYLSVKSDSRWKTFADFVNEAKKRPGELKYATWGPASSSNAIMGMISEAAGIKLTFVPFPNSPQSLAAVAGGNVDIAVTFALSGVGSTGLIRALVVTDDQRVSDHPDVPTLKELGYNIKFKSQYMGLSAPRGTPDEVVAKLVDANNKVRVKYARQIEETLPKLDQYPAYLDGNETLAYLKDRTKTYDEYFRKMRK